MSQPSPNADEKQPTGPDISFWRFGWHSLSMACRGHRVILLDNYRHWALAKGIDLGNATSMEEARERCYASSLSNLTQQAEQIANAEREVVIGQRLYWWWFAFWTAIVPATAFAVVACVMLIGSRTVDLFDVAAIPVLAVMIFYPLSAVGIGIAIAFFRPYILIASWIAGFQQPQ